MPHQAHGSSLLHAHCGSGELSAPLLAGALGVGSQLISHGAPQRFLVVGLLTRLTVPVSGASGT